MDRIDDYGAELLVSAIIANAIQDHVRASKLLKRTEKIMREYEEVEFLLPRARRCKGDVEKTQIAARIFAIAKTRERKRYDLENACRTLVECENFFTSEYFKMISPVDGEALIRKLREKENIGLWEVENARNVWKSRGVHRADHGKRNGRNRP